MIDDYVADIMIVDGVLGRNSEYVKFCKKNDPYYLTCECHETTICKINLDGHCDENQLREAILSGIAEVNRDLEPKLQEYMEYVDSLANNSGDSSSALCVDDSGAYYYVLDTNDFSNSMDKIINSVVDISMHDPISSKEAQGYVDSYRRIGYLDGAYKIYLDNYGGEIVTYGITEYKSEDLRFSSEPRVVYKIAYDFVVGIEEYTDADNLMHMNYSIRVSDDTSQDYVRAYINGLEPVEPEDIIRCTYEFYEMLYNIHSEHGIKPLANLEFKGDLACKAEDSMIDVDISVTLDDLLTIEEYAGLCEEGISIYNPADYELPDDCF